jgi:DNA-binding TFAR19-related protein (PDSD5 family)
MQQQIAQLETIVKTLFTKRALQRYGNLRAAHPEKAVQLLAAVGQMMQSGKARKITDYDLKKILVMISPKTKEIKITRK